MVILDQCGKSPQQKLLRFSQNAYFANTKGFSNMVLGLYFFRLGLWYSRYVARNYSQYRPCLKLGMNAKFILGFLKGILEWKKKSCLNKIGRHLRTGTGRGGTGTGRGGTGNGQRLDRKWAPVAAIPFPGSYSRALGSQSWLKESSPTKKIKTSQIFILLGLFTQK